MSAQQGKYFLVEESQARLSAEENVVELGFALTYIQTPKKKRITREPISLFKRLLLGSTAKSEAITSSAAEGAMQKHSTVSSASSTASQFGGKLSTSPSSKVTKAPAAGVRQTVATSNARESKTAVQYPTCLLRVFACEETDKPVASLPQDAWREVYQSDVHRIMNLAPVTLTALLLLPVPPISATNGVDLRDRPIRFELWVSAATSSNMIKKAQPDVLMGIKETTLGRILKSLGSPKRFAHSPTCQSFWGTVYLKNPETLPTPSKGQASVGPSAYSTPDLDPPIDPAEYSHLELRVAFPDRLISVSVPPSAREVEPTVWRLAPLFSGPTLRGLTFSPVSRGFQATVSDGAETSTTMMIEPKKRITKFLKNSTTLMEFREEMAEMPLNLSIPAAFLDQAAMLLEQTSAGYVQKVKSDMNLLRKLAQSDLALTGTDLVQKKILESNEKLEKFAQEVASKGQERSLEMKEIARFYREQWAYVVLGGDRAGAIQRLKHGSSGVNAASNHGKPNPDHRVSRLMMGREHSNSVSSQTSVSEASTSGGLTLGSGIGSASMALAPLTVAAMLEEESTNHASRAASSLSDVVVELEGLPPPPSTPNPFDNVILSRGGDLLEMMNEEDEDDRQEMQMKDEFEKTVLQKSGGGGGGGAGGGGKNPLIAGGGNNHPSGLDASRCAITTFRPSTSRKDRRLRFMPINMHLQVLTVRETAVKQKPVQTKKSSSANNVGSGGHPMGMRQRLRSVAESMVPTRSRMLSTTQLPPMMASERGIAALTGGASSASAHTSGMLPNTTTTASKHLSKDSTIVPPISEESEGPLLLASRRKGRQSIMASTLDPTGAETPRTRYTSSGGRNNTLGHEFDDDENNPLDDQESFFYDTISAGAPSAHHLSSKYGGLWQLFNHVVRAKDEAKKARDDSKADLVAKLESYRKAREMEWIFAERTDVVLPQAISIIVGSVVARLFVMAAEYSASVVGGFEEPDDEVAQSIVKHGFLIGWESLLSTHGKELAMLGDLFYAVRYVSEHCVLRLEEFEKKDDDDIENNDKDALPEENENEEEEKMMEQRNSDRVNSSMGSLPPGDSTIADDLSSNATSTGVGGEKLLKESLDIRLFRTTSKSRVAMTAALIAKEGGADPSKWSETAPWMGPGMSEDGSMWLVVARIPSTVVEKLPKVLREYIEQSSSAALGPLNESSTTSAASSSMTTSLFDLPPATVVDLETLPIKPLSWTCVLFSQGINEMQNIANMVGTRALQEEINEFSCMRLVEYCRKRFEVRPAKEQFSQSASGANSSAKKMSLASQTSRDSTNSTSKPNSKSLVRDSATSQTLMSKEAQAKDEERRRRAEVAYRQSLVWAAKLKVAVSNQGQTAKSFEILQNSADLVRWLSGIRIASCKSAKDRTAMSLTWEEARILHNVHFVRDIGLLDLANLFREHGTRLINVHKNTGVPRYAFNKTQRSFLPEFYRPPPNTIGGYFGMSNVT